MKTGVITCIMVGVLASVGCSNYDNREARQRTDQKLQETREKLREDLKRADAQTKEDLDKARDQLHQALNQSEHDLHKAQKDLNDHKYDRDHDNPNDGNNPQ